MFSKNIRTLYLYVVSFIALMAMIAGTVALVESVTNYFYPVAYISAPYTSNSYYDEQGNYQTKGDYTTTYSRENEERRVQRETLKNIFTSLAVVVVSTALYSYHWSMVEKERKKE